MQAAIGRIILRGGLGSGALVCGALLVGASGSLVAETTVPDDAVGTATGKAASTTADASPSNGVTVTLRPRWVAPKRASEDDGSGGGDAGAEASAESSGARVASDSDASTDADTKVEAKTDSRIALPPTATASRTDGTVADWRDDARIVIHGNDETDRLSSLVAGLLQDLGANDIERVSVDISVSEDHIRYFHAEDGAMARALAAELEDVFGSVGLRGLPRYRPSPRPGLLELWLR